MPNAMLTIADPASLAALTTTAKIEVGSYDVINIGTCREKETYTTRVKGTVDLDAGAGVVPYYTTSAAVPLSTSGSPHYTTLTFTGCGTDYKIPGGLVVSEDSAVEINLLMSLDKIAWGKIGATTIPSGCFSGGTPSLEVCMSYPEVVPYVGVSIPKVETYEIVETAPAPVGTAGGRVILLFDQADAYIGGFMRRLYGENSQAPSVSYDTPIHRFIDNGDSTYTISDYGSSADGSQYYLLFENFKRDASPSGHTGVLYGPNHAGPYSYSATQL